MAIKFVLILEMSKFAPCYSMISPGGGIGRRAGLKHQWPQGRAGSTPALGTKSEKPSGNVRGLFEYKKK